MTIKHGCLPVLTLFLLLSGISQARTVPDIYMLDYCWPADSEQLQLKVRLKQVDVHCKVEDVIILAYHWALLSQPSQEAARKLVNAPISGQTKKRGRHLLSFAAFNGFRRLAEWGLANGALINRGDKDNATLLRMSIANGLDYMIEFALSKNADPNRVFGVEGNRDIALSALVKWQGSLQAFNRVIEKGGKFRDPDEYSDIGLYLQALGEREGIPPGTMKQLFDQLDANGFLENPVLAVRSPQVATEMIRLMDQALRNAMLSEQLISEELDNYDVHGKPFEHFLAFNGFDLSLAMRLNRLPPEIAQQKALRRDREGNDLLLAAIKSKSLTAVNIVLSITRENINTEVPDDPEYYSRGDTPMTVARKWQVSGAIIKALIAAGSLP